MRDVRHRSEQGGGVGNEKLKVKKQIRIGKNEIVENEKIKVKLRKDKGAIGISQNKL